MTDSGDAPPRRVVNLTTASFALRPEQVTQLRLLAAQRGISQSALVREAIDLLLRTIVRDAITELEHRQASQDPTSRGNPLVPSLDHADVADEDHAAGPSLPPGVEPGKSAVPGADG